MYKFRLQRVLELREKREGEAATELATARKHADLALQAARRLEDEQRSHIEKVAAATATGGGLSVGPLQNLSLLVQRMSERVDDAYRTVDTAELQVRERMTQFTTAFKDRQVIDKLKSRDQLAWHAAEAQADRTAMDGIALTQYLRSLKPVSGNGGQ
jgi:flagellar protein FliJ